MKPGRSMPETGMLFFFKEQNASRVRIAFTGIMCYILRYMIFRLEYHITIVFLGTKDKLSRRKFL